MATTALDIPTRDLKGVKIPLDVLRYVPRSSAEYFQILPLAVVEGVLEVGLVDPRNPEALDALQFITNKNNVPYKIFSITKGAFEEGLKSYGVASTNTEGSVDNAGGFSTNFGGASGLEDLGQNIQEAEKTVASFSAVRDNDLNKPKVGIVEEAPVTKIVSVILQNAVAGGASDIHIEPEADKVHVRFRVDGLLFTSLDRIPKTVHDAIVARVKILTNMKLDEKRKPQDGRFSANIEGRRVDFRVSTFPTYFGEKVVMRILDPEKKLLTLESMGMSPDQIKIVRESINRPYGIILLTGPTGSGKSTTLYAMLSEVDRAKYNVVTLEDPIEYNIAGVSQSQVQPDIEYTFANGLRSIMRQDPDIIMVGEIRDRETAKIAIHAALTGHLVFSTLHTNTAAGVVPRLIDMGVDPFLIPPTLVLAIGQRLVPTLCPEAKKSTMLDDSMKVMIDKQFADMPAEFRSRLPAVEKMYHSQNTAACPSGTRGRIGVFEFLKMDHDIEGVILKNPVESEIYRMARAKGFLTLKEDAIMKASQGLISFEEVNKL
ncbi:MAG: hypothetical protein A2607_00830 [Candidatus Vogelbacteria bacterium RIFOXYD1_FULL_42_15]|uniref:Bacterial type II secretion system protein E domain-containing protein n=1 Tax=Candidatus Vogelbacteria bacterium RIFOXYD1_FULL_42_15 TaxID=1802437 RepID=A0A1G2QJ64_9BACT|nr:MAG: hypothetical protein A2607_00830 [Candidatus Vogelbacteria bacterium RIFOXYD1_FULL_42_15]